MGGRVSPKTTIRGQNYKTADGKRDEECIQKSSQTSELHRGGRRLSSRNFSVRSEV